MSHRLQVGTKEVSSIVEDAMLSANLNQRQALWKLRDEMSAAQKPEGGSIKHDISVPVAAVPAFIAEADAAVVKLIPGARPVPFGHLGDGNLHYNVSQPVGAEAADFLARWHDVNAVVFAIVLRMGGSISAEHGIGVLKRDVRFRFTYEAHNPATRGEAEDQPRFLRRTSIIMRIDAERAMVALQHRRQGHGSEKHDTARAFRDDHSPPMQIRCEKVRRYMRPSATAGVAWLFSPRGFTASNSYLGPARSTTTSPSVVIA